MLIMIFTSKKFRNSSDEELGKKNVDIPVKESKSSDLENNENLKVLDKLDFKTLYSTNYSFRIYKFTDLLNINKLVIRFFVINAKKWFDPVQHL